MKVSVVTICYQSQATIADTMRSVAEQTWQDVEHIVVDGASPDATLEVVRAHATPRTRVVSEPDRGIYDAMNKGIRLATGDVIGFLNADDFYATPRSLEMVARTLSNPEVDACYGDLCYVRQDDASRIVRYWRSGPHRRGAFGSGWVPPHPTLYVRREFLQRSGGFNVDYPIAADFELMARLMERDQLRSTHIPEVLVMMRLGGTTNRSWSNVLQQNREIWRAMQTLQLRPSLVAFAVRKLMSRGVQFLRRPE